MSYNEYPETVKVTTIKDGRYCPLLLKDRDIIYIPDRCISGKYVPRRVVLGGYHCPPNHIPLFSEHRCKVFLYKLPAIVYNWDCSHNFCGQEIESDENETTITRGLTNV